MKSVYVFEELTAVKLEPGNPLSSLRTEGLAILKALIDDFSKQEQYKLFVFASEDVGESLLSEKLIDLGQLIYTEETNPFLDIVKPGDKVLIMAPESEGILSRRINQLSQTEGESLCCTEGVVCLAGDKYETFLFLNKNKIPTPDTMLLRDFIENPRLDLPLVLKPRDGAGTSDTFYCESLDFIKEKAFDLANRESWIVQEFKHGIPASYCFLRVHGELKPIVSSFQFVNRVEDQFFYKGGSIPLTPSLDDRALALAKLTLNEFEGLNGWVGVDMILGDEPNGRNDFVCEINPRLTTAYLGARQYLDVNLASMLVGSDLGFSRVLIKVNNVTYGKDGLFEINQRQT